LREVIDRLRPRLRTFRDQEGRELFDLPDAPRPDPDVPAPPRFLPEYDNVLLGYADRTRMSSDETRRRLTADAMAGANFGTVLVDGVVRAIWRIKRKGKIATLSVEPLGRLSKKDAAAVDEEGTRLLAFTDGEADTRDVRIEGAIGGRGRS
jgi:hypothetical protein